LQLNGIGLLRRKLGAYDSRGRFLFICAIDLAKRLECAGLPALSEVERVPH
jgi:hypothetical protein